MEEANVLNHKNQSDAIIVKVRVICQMLAQTLQKKESDLLQHVEIAIKKVI